MRKKREQGFGYLHVLLASVFLLLLVGLAVATNGEEISQWNSVTEDASDSFSVDICVDKGREVEFAVSSNLSYTWVWSVNGEEIKESEGAGSNLSYAFEDYGVYNVSVVGKGKGENETTECVSWYVTASLVIGKENDLTEIEGFENYTFYLAERPKRIVSLAPSCTETLFAIGAGERVVGVTNFCNYPSEVVDKVNRGEIEVIGGYSTPDIDKITNLNPDIIVEAHNPGIGDVISSLVESGYKVIDLHSTDIEDIIGEIRFMGKVLKCGDNATNLANELENRLERVRERVGPLKEEQRPRTFYTCSNFWTPGNDTFISAVIQSAGGRNIAANYGSGYFQISPAHLAEENPQVIICPSEDAREQILNDEQLRELNAVKYGRVHVINGDIICRPGPRIVDAVETVYGYLSVLIKPTMTYPTLQYNAQRTGNVPGKGPVKSNLFWQSPDETHGCIQAGPVVHDGKVYIETWYSGMGGEDPGETDALYCLNEDTGEIVWMNEEVYGASTAAIAEGKLFVGTMKGNITSINATNGEILWSKKIEENPSWYGVASSPLVFNEMVYVLSFSDGTLHAFSFDGIEQWNFSTGGKIFCYSSPSAYGDKIFFAGNNREHGQHALYCLNLNTREEVWNFTTETEIRGSPTIWDEEGMVFFTTRYLPTKESGIYAVNITTGEEIWHKKHKSSWASPALCNGKLYIGGSAGDSTFYCYDARNGSLIWENKEMGGAIDSSPVVAAGKVYFGTSEVDGTVYALDANNGSIIWNYTLHIPLGYGGGYNVASHPAISNSTLFIGVDNVGVLAFRENYERNQTTALGALDAAVQKPVFWEGEVTLLENTTVNVIAHNSGESYEINQTTALGALDAAAEAGEFNYTVSDEWYASWGSLMVDSIAGKESDPVTWDGWLYWVNYLDDPMPMVGTNQYEVEDGDVVTYYYGGMSTTPDNSSMLIRIHVHVQKPVFWEGEVTLLENTTVNVTAHNSGESYEINQTTALGALDAAAEAGGFNYTVSDEWYASWGSLMVESIAGKENDPVTWDGWLYWVNYLDDPMPMVGTNQYEVEDGDVVTYYYGGMSTTPDNSSISIRIHVHVQSSAPINEIEYRKMIPQPVNISKIHYKSKVVNEEWAAIWTNKILYVQEKTRYSIAISLDRAGYVTSVDFERWGFPTTEIPYDLAVRSLDKLIS
ncbi:hypothetical protein DRN97_00350 [Methanosarcinales archaeon]|nr:MAG: hypothetical protein DRN97_00350 [Methanosarcinales archaeon]